jgi:hypothetical protein
MRQPCALVGPTDVGKSTLSKILCNYAVRKGWNPLFVDLDLGQGGITCPATIGAVPVDRPIDVSEGLPLEMPLVYFHGKGRLPPLLTVYPQCSRYYRPEAASVQSCLTTIYAILHFTVFA